MTIAEPHILALLAKHGLPSAPVRGAATEGIANAAFLAGDVCVRVCKDLELEEDSWTERVAVPVAVEAGVPTPRLLVFDADRDIVPSVATIYEAVPGAPLAVARPTWDATYDSMRWIGTQAAKLALAVARVDDPEGHLDGPWPRDPESAIREAAADQTISEQEADLLLKWCRRIPDGPDRLVFCHQDLHLMNVLADPESGRPRAIIDWGDAGWDDPSSMFRSLPPHLVPEAVEAYRLAGGPADDLLEAKVLRGLLEASVDDEAGDEAWWPQGPQWQPNLESLHRLRTRSDLPARWIPLVADQA